MKKAVQGIILGVLSLLWIVLQITNTEAGTRFLLQKLLSPYAKISTVHGRLWNRVVLQGIHVNMPTANVDVDTAIVQWQPWKLCLWQLALDTLELKRLTVLTQASVNQPSSMPQLGFLHWPWYWPSVEVKYLSVNQTSIQIDPEHYLRLAHCQTALQIHHKDFAWSLHAWAVDYDRYPPWDMHWDIRGPWHAYRFVLQAQPLHSSSGFSLEGTGGRDHLNLDRLSQAWIPVDTQFRVHLAWWPRLEAKGQLQIQDLNLASWWSDYPSRLSIALQAEAQINPESWQIQRGWLQLQQLQGQIRHKPVQGQGRLSWSSQELKVEGLRLQVAQALIRVNGILSKPHTDFNWQIDVPDLADLWPQAQGKLVSKGYLQGGVHPYLFEVYLDAKRLKLQALAAKQAFIQLDYRAAKPEWFHLKCTGQDWHWNRWGLDQLSIESHGQYAKQTIDWSLLAPWIHTHGQLLGGFDETHTWRGMLADWQWAFPQGAPWRLETRVPLLIALDHVDVSKPVCLKQGHQWLCGQGAWKAQGSWSVGLSSSDLDLMPWSWLCPEDVRLSGQIQGVLTAKGAAMQLLESHVDIKTRALQLGLQQGQDSLALPLGDTHLKVDSTPKAAKATWAMTGSLGEWQAFLQAMEWNGWLSKWQEWPLTGTLTGQLRRLDGLSAFVPNTLQSLQGRLDVKGRYQGTWAQHQSFLDMHLQEARVRLPDYNIELNPVDLRLQGDPTALLAVTGRLQSGPGQLQLRGTLDQLWENPRIHVNLNGKNFLATNLSSYRIYASPDLQLRYQAKELHLDGDLLIPKANLRFVDYQKHVVKLSSDVVYVDTKDSMFHFYSQMRVLLGNQVELQYGGLTGRLLGQVALDEQPNRQTAGRGQIRLVDAHYRAYGQTFTLRKGVMEFMGGEVDNPTVDMEAVRQLTDVVPVSETGQVVQSQEIVGVNNGLLVGIRIHGPVKTAQIQLFSVPPGLSQADILSYLLLGRPTSEATGSNAQLLMSAASLLNNGSGTLGQLQQQLKNTLGLEVDVGATSQYSKETQTVNQNTSVILGKALSPRLFLNYSIGIAQPVNVLRLTYKISPSWSAQSESSSLGNGGDLFYTINRY